jgi:hypothetical protein
METSVKKSTARKLFRTNDMEILSKKDGFFSSGLEALPARSPETGAFAEESAEFRARAASSDEIRASSRSFSKSSLYVMR